MDISPLVPLYTTTTIYIPGFTPSKWSIKGFTPSKLYIFIWNVAKFLLTPQSNDRRNYEGNDAQEKFLTPMVPPMQRTCFFQLFSDFFRDFFWQRPPYRLKWWWWYTIQPTARWVSWTGCGAVGWWCVAFFIGCGAVQVLKNLISACYYQQILRFYTKKMLLFINLHEKNYKLLLMRMLCILRSRNGTWFKKICRISSRKYCS